MVTVVVVANLLIALTCLYVAWRVWQIRRVLAIAADVVAIAERNTYNVLSRAPQGISRGQIGTSQLRSRYQKLRLQVQRLEEILQLINLLQRSWLWRSPKIGTRRL